MSLDLAAASLVKLVATDQEFFARSVEATHDDLTWLTRKRAQAHKFVDILFDGLEKSKKAELDDLLQHTLANGLVTRETLTEAKGTDIVPSDQQ